MLKFFKEHWISTLIIIVCLVLIIFCLININDQKKIKVIHDGGNFRIVSYNDATYIINYDIYGGTHEIKSESNQTCGENKAGRTE